MKDIAIQIMRCIVGACDDTCIYYCAEKPHCGMSEIEFNEINKWLDTAEKSLEKAEKYKWHDLRKNKDDLPCEDLFFRSLLCVNDSGDYITDCDLHYSDEAGWFEAESEGIYLTNVIAWREIEPFEEAEE